MGFRITFLAAALAINATDALGQTACSDSRISVVADPARITPICDLASSAIDELAECSLPVRGAIEVEITDTLPDGCAGEYHCFDRRIVMLSQDAARRFVDVDGMFSGLQPRTFFYGILVHELAHAALENMTCPFGDCITTREYVAYAMQMRSYPPDARETLLTRPDFDRPITREEINPFILLMAPDVFIQKVWRHFSQQPDPCGFIGDIMAGQYLFDMELP